MFFVARQMLTKLLKGRGPMVLLGYSGIESGGANGNGPGSPFAKMHKLRTDSVEKASHTFRGITILSYCYYLQMDRRKKRTQDENHLLCREKNV